MKRYLCYFSLLGVIAVPDWASAFHPCWCPPPPCGFYGRPRLLYPRPLAMASPCVPVYGVPFPAPQVYTVPPAMTIISPPAMPAAIARPVPAPAPAGAEVNQPIRPAGGEQSPATKPAKPATSAGLPPPTVVPDPPAKSAASEPKSLPPVAKSAAQDPNMVPAAANAPKLQEDAAGSAPKSSTPTLVPDPPAKAAEPEPKKTPPLVLPPLPKSKASSDTNPSTVPTPNATPSPAPPPNDVEPLISPPMLPTLPGASEPTKPAGSSDSLPPLVLPPEAPGGSSGIVPESTSRSSPLSAGFKVQIFTAPGTMRAVATRKIGFFNHTNRDINLVIEGRAVKLPRKTYIHAEVPPTFAWGHSGNPARPATVPAGSPGLDVLFRE